MERKDCIYPLVIEASNGRATCPPNLKKSFLDHENCHKCPKTSSLISIKPKATKADIDTFNVMGPGGFRYS